MNQALAYERLYDYCQRRKKSKKSLYKRPDALSVKRAADAIAGGRTRRYLSKLPLTALKESQLKQIIKEELDKFLNEQADPGMIVTTKSNYGEYKLDPKTGKKVPVISDYTKFQTSQNRLKKDFPFSPFDTIYPTCTTFGSCTGNPKIPSPNKISYLSFSTSCK